MVAEEEAHHPADNPAAGGTLQAVAVGIPADTDFDVGIHLVVDDVEGIRWVPIQILVGEPDHRHRRTLDIRFGTLVGVGIPVEERRIEVGPLVVHRLEVLEASAVGTLAFREEGEVLRGRWVRHRLMRGLLRIGLRYQ